MDIRQETPQDYAAVYLLIKEAFATAAHRDGDEQDYAAALRTKDSFIPALSLVAEENGEIVGQIMLTETEIVDGTRRHAFLLLSPIAVASAQQKKGIGAALIAESFKRAMALGYTAVFLVGDPLYYRRFGFWPTIKFGIQPPDGLRGHEENVMVRELEAGALQGIHGVADIC